MRWMIFPAAVSTAAPLGAHVPRLTPMVSVPVRRGPYGGPYDGASAGSGASPALSAVDQNTSEET